MFVKKIVFGLALVSSICAATASAQSLVGVTAQLDRNLDSKTATVGQVVTAKLDGAVKTGDGFTLRRGTELIGKVVAVKASRGGSPASVSVEFGSASSRDGRQVPVKATVLAAFPASDVVQSGDAEVIMGPPPQHVSDDQSIEQLPGTLGKVAMTSAVDRTVSGTFSEASRNFRLSAGTYFQIGIAPTEIGSATSAAE
jgi:hypothetical protein